MHNPELHHINFRDIGLPKQEITQAVVTPSTPHTSSSQDDQHHINCTALSPISRSSTGTTPKYDTASSKAISYQIDTTMFYHEVDIPSAPRSPPEIRRTLSTTTPLVGHAGPPTQGSVHAHQY
jgi:hypothetical protein